MKITSSNKSRLFIFAFLLLYFNNICSLNAQTFPSKEELWDNIRQLYDTTVAHIETEASLPDSLSLFTSKCQVSEVKTSELAQFLEEESNYWDKNYGLELRGGITSDDLEDSNFDQLGNTYLELSWDVLGNGYKEYDFRAEDLKRRASLEKIRGKIQAQTLNRRCSDLSIQKNFQTYEYLLTEQFLEFMETIFSIEERSYFKRENKLDELFISEESVVQLTESLKRLKQTIEQLNEYPVNPPLIDFNYQALLDATKQNPLYKQLLSLERQGIANDNPYRDGNRLRLFVRKEFDILASDRDSVIAGLRFFIPLSLADRGDNEHKINQLEIDAETADWEREALVKSAYINFSSQRERAITQHYRYLRAKERIRRAIVSYEIGQDISLPATVARLKTMVEASIELIRVKKSVYHRINSVLNTARIDFTVELIESVSLLDNSRRRTGNRSVYLWSSAFNQLSNRTLINVFESKGINRVMVSLSSKTNKNKLDSFLKVASNNNVQIELIVGANEWVNPNKYDSAALSVLAASRMTEWVHLDIEPQTFSDYKQRKLQYQKEYVDMLESIKQSNPDTKINVSVPFHWEANTYSAISSYVDMITIMLYENSSPTVINRRVQRILELIPNEKITIALRPKDFKDEYEYENVIRTLKQETGVNNFALHKMADLINTGVE